MSRADLETTNILLRTLDPGARDLLGPHLVRVPLEREQTLISIGQQVETIHFPEGGVTSCVAIESGMKTEVGLVGCEGLTGISAAFGDDVSQFETFVQVNGATALAIPLDRLRDAMEEHPALRHLLGLYMSFFLYQVSYGLVSSAQHLLEARLARWLLMCHDRVPGDDIPITHEFMGMMISAQRSGVTVTLHSLEGNGMIRSTRGLVTIRDRSKLEEIAGGAYGLPEARYREMIGPFGK